jgi:hypothetical protein
MKTLFITALLAITVASCNQKVKEVEAAETTATANELYACSMHPEVTGKRFRMSGMWYGTNRESGARYSNGKEDANNADETKMQCQTLKQLRQLRLQLMKL